MFKALVKKQFTELFRGYFVNSKKGTARSKKQTVWRFILFGFLMLFLSVAFFGLSTTLAPLLETEMEWLYFAIMGLMSIALGTFGSVFNTYTVLYQAKDNDMLLSMPIPPSVILTARIVELFSMAFLYSVVVWFPAVLYYWIFCSPTILAVIFDLLLAVVIAFFVSVLTCALGWLVALLSSKLKNKSIFTVILSLIFFAIYYVICFRLQSILEAIIASSGQIGNKVKAWAYIIYEMGRGAQGQVVPMIVFTLVTAALCALCFYILSKSFVKILTTNRGTKKAVYKEKETKALDVKTTLFRRELRRYTSSSTYMLNCTLGSLFLIAIAVIGFIKADAIHELLLLAPEELPGIVPFIPLGVIACIGLIVAINTISTPSISLEGKSIWILQSLPVKGFQVLSAKLNLHLLMNAVPSLITALCLSIVLKLDFTLTVYDMLYLWMFIWLTGAIGLIIGLKRPNFTWTNEAMPIKQNINVMFSWVIAWVLLIVTCGGYYLVRNMIEVDSYLLIWIVGMAIVMRFILKWMSTKGEKAFADL